MTKFTFTLLLWSSLAFYGVYAQTMDNDKLGKILENISDTLEGGNGQWKFIFKEIPMLCLTDQAHNRMRVITPVVELKDVGEEELMACMKANFHTALDVKYAISEDILWVAYIHPLKELSESQFKDAIAQVFFAAVTYGSTYSSTDLVFPDRSKE